MGLNPLESLYSLREFGIFFVRIVTHIGNDISTHIQT